MRHSLVAITCAFLVGLFLASCSSKQDGPRVEADQPQKTPDYENRRIAPEKHLPKAAKNVQLFNNFWTYFELDVGGKNRKFLMHHSFPKDDWQGRESLVELRD